MAGCTAFCATRANLDGPRDGARSRSEDGLNFAQGFGLSLLQLVLGVFDLYTWVIIIRALVSWVSPDPHNPLVRMLHVATEPVLRPLRRLAPPHKLGGLDLSPLLAILILQFVKNGIVYSLGYSPRFLF